MKLIEIYKYINISKKSWQFLNKETCGNVLNKETYRQFLNKEICGKFSNKQTKKSEKFSKKQKKFSNKAEFQVFRQRNIMQILQGGKGLGVCKEKHWTFSNIKQN